MKYPNLDNSNESHKALVEGKTYWFAIVKLHNKRTALDCTYEPFQIILTQKKNKKWGKDWEDFCDLSWDVSANKKYAKRCNAEYDVDFYGLVADTQEECIQMFNKAIDEAWDTIKSNSDKSASTMKYIKEDLMSRKITNPVKI